MDFCIETGDLQRVIKLLSVTVKMNALDSTGMVLIKAEDDLVRFLSNNGSTALSFVSNKVAVKVPGTAVIEYSRIKSFVASFRAWDGSCGVKEFHFKLTKNFLNVSVENIHENNEVSKGNLRLKIYDSYIVREPSGFKTPNFTLNSNIFKTAINKILYAIDPSESRAFIQGMNIIFDEKEILFAGTDGRKLSEYKVKNISDLADGKFLLKYDFIMGLRRIVDSEKPLTFEFDKSNVKVGFDNVVFWGRNIIGHEFPEYRAMLKAFNNTIVLDKDILISSLLPFNDVLNPEDNNRLTFSLSEGVMTFSCDVAEFTYNGKVDYSDDFVIDVNGNYMLQTIEVIKDDKITVSFSDEKGPLIFNSGNFEDQAALVTPLRRR
jgi:DNA polymerase III sliding clamp (beta) subunit (PCNA family)